MPRRVTVAILLSEEVELDEEAGADDEGHGIGAGGE
jgi:hypothetical protein